MEEFVQNSANILMEKKKKRCWAYYKHTHLHGVTHRNVILGQMNSKFSVS